MDQTWLVLVGVVALVTVTTLSVVVWKRRSRKWATIDSLDNTSIRMSTDGVDGNPTLSDQSRSARERDAIAKASVGNKMLYYGRYRHF